MNSETQPTLEQIAKDAGAVKPCGVCGNYDIAAYDGEADRRAYAMATEAWKRGEFRSDAREDIMRAMKSVLDDANHRCPGGC